MLHDNLDRKERQKEEYYLMSTNTSSITQGNTTLITLHKITRIKIHQVK